MKTANVLAAIAVAAALLAPLPAAAAPTGERYPAATGEGSGDRTMNRKVAGGSPTSIFAAPAAAQISFDGAGTDVRCAGSQISASWVITAKHCNSPSLKSVRLGSTYLEAHGAVRTVAARYASPMGDLLLLRLSTPYSGATVGLSASLPASGTAAKVYGWGYQAEGSGSMSYFLKTADVTVAGPGSDSYGGASVSTRSQSGHPIGGDSGGPLMVDGKLAGVLSESSVLPAGTTSDYSQYYSDHASIARNLDWITRISGVIGS